MRCLTKGGVINSKYLLRRKHNAFNIVNMKTMYEHCCSFTFAPLLSEIYYEGLRH